MPTSPQQSPALTRRQFISRSGALALLASARGLASNSARESGGEKLAADPQRPRYHFLPAAGWMNDPNGPLQWKGEYHLFYQYNPNGAFWGTMHWGHARSKDLVHWEHLPIALAPTLGSYDKDGVFSGSAFVNNGVPTMVYTGVNPETQCLASSEDLIHWTKFAGNPVVAAPPAGLKVTGFRDPSVWKEGDTWLMTVGAGVRGQGGVVLLYASKDTIHWEYLHPLCEGPAFLPRPSTDWPADDPVATGEMWECPDFFPLGNRHALLVSTQGYVFYMIGTYRDRRFRPEFKGRADLGGRIYAAKSMPDDRGRRILWGWVREGRSEAAYRASGWAGVMATPRILTLLPDGQVGIEPAPEFEMLRRNHRHAEGREVTSATTATLEGVRGDALEIIAEFEPGNAQAFGLKFRCSPDSAEQTYLLYDRGTQQLTLERQSSSLSPDVNRAAQSGPFELGAGEKLRLRLFLDGSLLEAFANGRVVLTERIYPTRADSLGIGLAARGGGASLVSLDAWEIEPISADRLTT